ncbi:hypothetical protein P7C70_g7043, partial [Phenoliferia sp. Uapishka_3]
EENNNDGDQGGDAREDEDEDEENTGERIGNTGDGEETSADEGENGESGIVAAENGSNDEGEFGNDEESEGRQSSTGGQATGEEDEEEASSEKESPGSSNGGYGTSEDNEEDSNTSSKETTGSSKGGYGSDEDNEDGSNTSSKGGYGTSEDNEDDSNTSSNNNLEDMPKIISSSNEEKEVEADRLDAVGDAGSGTTDGETSSTTESSIKETGSSKMEGMVALDAFDEDGYNMTPTVLPVGPTRANPMNAKPNAMAFFHIPLPESYDQPIDVGADGKRLLVGERYEGNGASKTNSGMFETAILHQGELLAGDAEVKDEFWEGEFSAPTTGRPEVKVVANGHCHVSEDCRRVKGVWLCFGGGASYSGYGKAGFARRMRVYTIADYGETIGTYVLLDTLKRIERIVLVGEGAMGT